MGEQSALEALEAKVQAIATDYSGIVAYLDIVAELEAALTAAASATTGDPLLDGKQPCATCGVAGKITFDPADGYGCSNCGSNDSMAYHVSKRTMQQPALPEYSHFTGKLNDGKPNEIAAALADHPLVESAYEAAMVPADEQPEMTLEELKAAAPAAETVRSCGLDGCLWPKFQGAERGE